MQRDKLKKQKIAQKNQETIAKGIKKMLFDKDGEIKKVESTKDALNRNRRGRVRSTRAAVGSEGSGTKSGTPKKLPPGNKGGPLAKNKPQLTGNTVKGLLKGAGSNANKVLRFGTRLLAGRDDGSGSALLAAKMTSDAIDAARGSTAEERNAGKTKPKKKPTTKTNSRGGQGGSRAAVNRKPKEDKPKRQVTSRNRRGRPTSYAAPVKPAKRGLSNIPSKEGTGGEAETTLKYGAGKPKKSTVKASTPKGGSKGATGASKAGSGASGKNPYRAPQGSERKDRMSKVVKELRAMQERSKERQGVKKKPQSKANKKGWPGNKNY